DTSLCMKIMHVLLIYFFFFFFSSRRRHTRSYGDWSSDVCSSDLEGRFEPVGAMWVETDCNLTSGESLIRQILHGIRFTQREFGRSEERRVGKECRSRWSRYQ